jgi:hypothetical protein
MFSSAASCYSVLLFSSPGAGYSSILINAKQIGTAHQMDVSDEKEPAHSDGSAGATGGGSLLGEHTP